MKIVFITVLTFLALDSQSQEATVSSGGDASGTNGTVSYTIGQIDYEYRTGSDGNITEGVQQIVVEPTSSLDENQTNIVLNAYPNPAYDHIVIETSATSGSENVSYKMYDTKGKLVKEGRISSEKTTVDVTELVGANYFLKVTQGNELIKSFKILKQ